MDISRNHINSINAYILTFPKDVRTKLTSLKNTIKKAAPDAKEKISYNMPTFTLNGTLVYFAGYKNHIGFYPMPKAIAFFKEELSEYKTSKGTVQFPLDKPLPISLIIKIVKFRVKENLNKIKK